MCICIYLCILQLDNIYIAVAKEMGFEPKSPSPHALMPRLQRVRLGVDPEGRLRGIGKMGPVRSVVGLSVVRLAVEDVLLLLLLLQVCLVKIIVLVVVWELEIDDSRGRGVDLGRDDERVGLGHLAVRPVAHHHVLRRAAARRPVPRRPRRVVLPARLDAWLEDLGPQDAQGGHAADDQRDGALCYSTSRLVISMVACNEREGRKRGPGQSRSELTWRGLTRRGTSLVIVATPP